MNETLAPIVGLLVVALITPGPNNFIVMVAATRGGYRQTVPIMIGIILGTVTLYLLACAGLAQLLTFYPKIRNVLLVAGVGHLAILGLRTIIQQTSSAGTLKFTTDPSLLGIALFQGLNTKSLILIATVAAGTSGSVAMLALSASVMAITAAACLSIWAMAGAVVSDWLAPAHTRRTFDMAMGWLLAASAIMLLLTG